jgi:hypothetical protein
VVPEQDQDLDHVLMVVLASLVQRNFAHAANAG